MAMQVTLVLAHPAASDGESLRLDSNSAGISITDWVPKIGNDGDAYVDEVLTLLIKGSGHDDLASKVQALDNMIRQVSYFRSSAQQKGIFLRCQMTNETGARQALVLAARRENATALYTAPASPGNVVEAYKLVLRRMPWWERADDVVVAAQTLAHCVGGTLSFSSIPGDVPARLMPLSFEGHAGGTTAPFYEFWAGFRTARYGTLANFVPVWECEDGTPDTDASSVAEATASGGDMITVTFATTETMASRLTIKASQVTANTADQCGRFLVLLRAKHGGTGAVYVRMATGWVATNVYDVGVRVAVSDANWLFYALGEVTFPPSQVRSLGALAMAEAGFRIDASGPAAAELYLDCLVLVPVDEGFCHISGARVQEDTGTIEKTAVGKEADEAIYTYCYYGTTLNQVTDPSGTSPAGFSLPIGSSTLVVVGRGSSASTLADHCDVAIAYTPRWAMLRGAE